MNKNNLHTNKSTCKVSIVGTGNVASALARHLSAANGIVLQSVVSREITQAEVFTQAYGFSHYTTNVADIQLSDYVLLCVTDAALPGIVARLQPNESTLYCHTAASVGIELFDTSQFNLFGVFYPLQTFSTNDLPNTKEFPLLVEGNTPETTAALLHLAKKITGLCSVMPSDKRLQLHVAAVMVNNFTNYLWAQAQQYCQAQQLDFDLLKPLIAKTAERALNTNQPLEKYQTGPAIRNDKTTIAKHLEILRNFPQYQALYRFLSNSINPKTQQTDE